MGLRICQVTPFSWSQPHDVNDHVAATRRALRDLGHDVCVLAPSNSARELADGRRALRRLARDGEPPAGLIALGPAVPVSRASRVGVPVGVRANLELALSRGGFDVVHGHEPGLPSLSYLALRDAPGLSVATFHSPERLGYPPSKTRRATLLGRIDALTAVGRATLAAAEKRFPGSYRLLPAGVDTETFRPGPERPWFVVEWDPDDRAGARAAIRALESIPGTTITVVRTRPLLGRPYAPRRLRERVSVESAFDGRQRAGLLRGALGFVPAAGGSAQLRVEALASGVPVIDPPARDEQPELIGAAMARLADDDEYRRRESAAARAAGEQESLARLGEQLDGLYGSLLGRRRARIVAADPLADRPWILADLHMHTDHSHDCSITVPALLDHAETIGLGAIAVTDHNVFAGAQEAAELARGRPLTVIAGEEVKTDDQGEVIGLFLREEIPRGMSMGDTIAAIRDQGGLVYLPHPFDRLHAIPEAATLHRHLAEIDVFEAYNARLLFDGFNDEALRFARKYNLLMGAGSDAHVLQGVGTGALRMRAFRTPEEFLISLRSAEIVRRPKSLLYLQSLKWVAQARERRTKTAVR